MLTLEQKQQFGLAACKAGDPDYIISDDNYTTAVDTVANVLLWLAAVNPEFDMSAVCDTATMHAMAEIAEGRG